MLYPTTSKALVSRCRNLGLAAAGLVCLTLAAPATPPMPRMPPEQEAALADPDPEVQYHALDY